MTRLALYVPHFDRRPAGLGTYVHEMCGRLIQYADSVELYTETPDTVPLEWRERVRIRVLPSSLVPASLGARLVARQAWLSTLFPIELRRSGADVLFVPFHDGMIFPSIPQVVVVHDLTPLVVPSAYFHPFLRLHMRRVLPLVLRRATVVAVSENTRRDLERLLGVRVTRVHVIGEGYDREVFRPRGAGEIDEVLARHRIERPYLLYSGTYAAHKNPQLLAQILEGCVERGHDLRLVLTGRHDAGEYHALRDRIRRRGLAGRVITPGYVERDDLSALMAGATAFLFPSLYEGFGLAPLEALASGAAVLSSNRASLPHVVGEGGVLLDPSDATRWVEAVTRLLHHERYSSQLRAGAIARAARFDWNRSAAELAGLLGMSRREQGAAAEPRPRT